MHVGIISTASIAEKTFAAIHASKTCVVSHVASRDEKKAQTFIYKLQNESEPLVQFPNIPVALGSYDEMFDSTANKVDAVYIPIPMNLRKAICIQALQAKKHVVAEKPLSAELSDVEELIGEANKNGCVFLDGTMLTHGRRINEVRELIWEKRACGDAENPVSTITASFSFPGGVDMMTGGNIRGDPKMESLGALGDLGHYCIRYAVEGLFLTSGSVKVLRARGDANVKNPQGAIMSFNGCVEFERTIVTPGELPNEKKKVFLNFSVSMLEGHQQKITFRGNRAALTVNDFCLPALNTHLPEREQKTKIIIENNNIITENCRVDHIQNSETIFVDESSTFQETNLWRNIEFVSKHLNEKRETEERMIAIEMNNTWQELMILTQQCISLCYQSSKEDGVWKKNESLIHFDE